MMSLRPVNFLLVATSLLAAAGCRTAGVGNLVRQDTLPSRAEESASDILVEHNRNAERIQSLEAQSTISSANRGAVGGLSGKLALELPRNFKLVLSGPINNVADIGSNDQEFWFWAKDSQEKAVYFCNYDATGASPLSAAGLQPDWIIEALGLRLIPDEEASRIKVTPGKDPGTIVLTERQKASHGEDLIKETILNEATGRIREHWVYAADHKTPLAHAVVTDYQEYPVASETDALPEKVYLPRKLRLEWMQKEKMALDVTLSKVKVNQKFTPERRQYLFVEPKIEGFARINLEGRSPVSSRSSVNTPTSVRETLPAPAPRVRLTEPSPMRIEGDSARARDPAEFAVDFPPSYARGIEEVVGPPIPTISDPSPRVVQARSGWRGSLVSGLER